MRKDTWIMIRDGWIFEREFDDETKAARETEHCNLNYQGLFTYQRCKGGFSPEQLKNHTKTLGF